MTPEEQKKAAVELLEACEHDDVPTAERLLAPDFVYENMEPSAAAWSVNGQEVSNRLDRDTFIKFGVPANKTVTRDGMHFRYDLLMSEGPHVAIFGGSDAIAHNGKPYANCYCWFFRFSGDRISLLREYRDTYLSRAVLFDQA
jgi:ketosteroid isomerase-like protein